jgi:hypothetical protein
MIMRVLGLSLAVLTVVLGCKAEVPNTPDPAPGGGMVSTNGIAGLVKAPPVMHKDNGGAWDSARGPLNEAPLAEVEVYLLGARGEKLDHPPAKTDAQGIFRFDSVPVEAGLLAVMPKAVEAYKPLMAYYRRGHASYVGVASTLVAGALQKAINDKPTLTYAAFDPEKVTALQQKAEAKVSDPMNAFSLHFLDILLIAWAKNDQELKKPLEALSPGVTAPRVEPTPPPFGKK